MIKAWSDEAWEVFALRGFVWVDVSGRRQPGDGATHAEPVFPTKGEVATEGAPPARHGPAVDGAPVTTGWPTLLPSSWRRRRRTRW